MKIEKLEEMLFKEENFDNVNLFSRENKKYASKLYNKLSSIDESEFFNNLFYGPNLFRKSYDFFRSLVPGKGLYNKQKSAKNKIKTAREVMRIAENYLPHVEDEISKYEIIFLSASLRKDHLNNKLKEMEKGNFRSSYEFKSSEMLKNKTEVQHPVRLKDSYCFGGMNIPKKEFHDMLYNENLPEDNKNVPDDEKNCKTDSENEKTLMENAKKRLDGLEKNINSKTNYKVLDSLRGHAENNSNNFRIVEENMNYLYSLKSKLEEIKKKAPLASMFYKDYLWSSGVKAL
jgi:hypothetical protein